MCKSEERIYQKYSGRKNQSDKLTIFKTPVSYLFLYQTFRRTNPTQTERKQGFKPKRILLSEQSFVFSNLEQVNFNELPFSHLMDDFQISDHQP